MLTWDLIDHLNLATTGQTSTSLNACSATLYVRSALTTPMVIVKDALMDITCQEQLATNVILSAQLALVVPRINAPDAPRDTFWMLPQTALGRQSKTLEDYAGTYATRILLDFIMY